MYFNTQLDWCILNSMYRLNDTLLKLKQLTTAATCTTNGADPWPTAAIGSKAQWGSLVGDTSTQPSDYFIISLQDNNFVCGQPKKATLYAYCNKYISDYLTHGNITDMLRTLKIDIVTGGTADSPIIATQKVSVSDSEVSNGVGQSCSCTECRVSCSPHPRKLVVKQFTIVFNGSRNILPKLTANRVTYPVSQTSGWTFCQENPAPPIFSEGPRPGPVLVHFNTFFLQNLPPVTNYRTALVTTSGTRRAINLNATNCGDINEPVSEGPL
jgi:hypothetical protein